MASQAARGKSALLASDYEGAIREYTAAIKESPTSPDFFTQRSIAHQRAGHLQESLADAEQGVLNAQKRAKREMIVEGQFRRGIALYKLGRLGDAQFVLGKVKEMQSDHKQADMWINKTKFDLNKVPEGDERGKCNVTETPAPPKTNIESSDDRPTCSAASTRDGTPAANTSSASPSTTYSAPAAPQQTPADKIRHEWYQSTEYVYFTLLAKGVPKDKTTIEITERAMSISFPLVTGSSYDLTLDPLFAPVVPEKCIKKVHPGKVEIIFIKAQPGQKWAALESSESVSTMTDSVTETKDNEVKRAVLSPSKPAGPSYPTSSKSGPKDWDKVASGLREVDEDGKLKDDDEDDMGGDPSNFFFKKLFKNADPDTQRAMMKSYTESNGTALSTNWAEVSKEKVKTEPPSGMEAKPWSN